jgi:molybdopterin synthase catalytic subunit
MERVVLAEELPEGFPKKFFSDPLSGALVIFEGRPRNDGDIGALYYEVHDSMALKELKRIREEALERFPVREIFIFHRKGLVKVGETSFVVAVYAKHRKEAFECCSWVVDEVKKRVPIWKREVKEDGSLGEWILGA